MTVAGRIPTCVAGVPIFRALPPASLEELGKALQHRRHHRGETVAVAGDRADHLVCAGFSRRLKALVEEGIIRQEGPRTVVILSLEKLREHTLG